MSKLQTYSLVRDFREIGTMVHASLPRNQRSMLSKCLCGILQLEAETGHYRRLDRELRFCKLCKGAWVEDEMHFIFTCSVLNDTREECILPLVDVHEEHENMSNHATTKCMLDKSNIKEFGKALEKLFMYRKNLLYKASQLI